jgi:hypothetical protein
MFWIALFAVSCRVFMTLEIFVYVLLESSYWRRSMARISCAACWMISAPVGSSQAEDALPPTAARRVWNEVAPAPWTPVAWELVGALRLLVAAVTLMPHLRDVFVFWIIGMRVSKGVEII